VAEKFWDWWMPDTGRVGIPASPFDDMEHYVGTITALKPVYVKRDGQPILLSQHDTFGDYYRARAPVGVALDGDEVPLAPEPADIDLHSTCYWYNARLSHYYTVENRVNDQQPPDDLLCVAALTLGLASALPAAVRELGRYDWADLRATRETACRVGLDGHGTPTPLLDLAGQVVGLAKRGLRARGLGEEPFLDPLVKRLQDRRCPADEAAALFEQDGIEGLVAARSL